MTNSLSTRPSLESYSSLEISLEIHDLFDGFLVDIKEKHYVQALEEIALKLFSSQAYFWINNSVQLFSITLNKYARYNFSIVSYSFMNKIIIIEKSPQNNISFDISIDPVNQSLICFPLIDSNKCTVGVMQCIKQSHFQAQDELNARMFCQNFRKYQA